MDEKVEEVGELGDTVGRVVDNLKERSHHEHKETTEEDRHGRSHW
jgi:hypothetical protein